MVNFSIFNELSLPLNRHDANQKLIVFFKLLADLKNKGLSQIRMSSDFKSYNILSQTSFEQFLGQQTDRDFKTRLKSFITNTIINIETPIINENEEEQANQLRCCEYFYNQDSTDGGLACCDIWNTISISFDSGDQWNYSKISLLKEELINDDVIESSIIINHASRLEHLNDHHILFQYLEEENKRNITPNNFWSEKEINFPNIVVFCPEVKNQIIGLDNTVFKQAISILRDVETTRKLITDYRHSGESQTVKDSPALKMQRIFNLNGENIFFEKHIKSFANGYRMYFLEQDSKVYIGYIGKHLPC